MVEVKELVAPSLKELFVKEITENILSGKLAIGEKLPNERELAQQMRVSRAVINGGLTALAHQGFVEMVPRKGAFVADYKNRGRVEILQAILQYNGGRLDPVTLDSIYEVRTCIERHIALLAAERRRQQDIEDLKGQLELLSRLDDPKELAEQTHEFYHLLSISSGNVIYPMNIQAYRIIYIPLLEVLYRHAPKDGRLSRYKKLVDLIEARDQKGAADCIAQISLGGRQLISEYYSPGQRF
jgi:DNA-binding FadR family transcriptional regulator